MTDLDLDRLEAIARAATPGEWHSLFGEDEIVLSQSGQVIIHCDYSATAAHVAAFQPVRALSLLATIRTLTKERDEAKKIVRDTLWMAGRYADGRMTYAVSEYNDALNIAVKAGIANDAKPARDGYSPEFTNALTRAEAAEAEAKGLREALADIAGTSLADPRAVEGAAECMVDRARTALEARHE